MRQRITLLGSLLLLSSMFLCHARQPERGYRGFIDWSNSVGEKTWIGTEQETGFFTGASTSHGFQFNPNFYLGAGLGMEKRNGYVSSWIVPVFIDVRTDQKFGKLTPFGDLRIGCHLTDGGGFYFSPSVGYRFNWGRKVGINIAAGISLRVRKYDLYEIIENQYGYYEYQKIGTTHHSTTFFSFRVGFDF